MGSAVAAERSPFEGFASPFDQRDDDLFELIVVEHARGFVQALLSKSAADPRNTGLARFAGEWLSGNPDASTCWHSAFTISGKRMGPEDADARHLSLAEAALRIAQSGVPGAWAFEPLGARVWFAQTLLPPAERVAFASDGSAASFVLGGARTERFRFERGAEGWRLSSGDARRVLTLPAISCAGRRVTLADSAEALGEEMTVRVPVSTEGAAALGARCSDALAIVERYAPAFTPWIGRVVRTIVPRTTGDATMYSGSSADKPGVVEMSFDCRPVQIAEMLVHESTHQYMHVATRVSRTHDGTDTTLYYSPVKQTGRPIQMILVAYHAFANVALFYRACLRGGIADDGYCARNEERTLPQLAELERALRTTRALTDVGEALWRPLARRLAED